MTYMYTITMTCASLRISITHLGKCVLLSLYKLCHSQTCVVVVVENTSMKVTTTFWTVNKSLS